MLQVPLNPARQVLGLAPDPTDSQWCVLKLLFTDRHTETWFFSSSAIADVRASLERADVRWSSASRQPSLHEAWKKMYRAEQMEPGFDHYDLDSDGGRRELISVYRVYEFPDGIGFSMVTALGRNLEFHMQMEPARLLLRYLEQFEWVWGSDPE